jgi:hypothetical protein
MRLLETWAAECGGSRTAALNQVGTPLLQLYGWTKSGMSDELVGSVAAYMRRFLAPKPQEMSDLQEVAAAAGSTVAGMKACLCRQGGVAFAARLQKAFVSLASQPQPGSERTER